MDDREPRDLMTQAMVICGCFAVEVQHLPVGDYLIDDALLIGRKTLADLVRSIDAHALAEVGGFAPDTIRKIRSAAGV